MNWIVYALLGTGVLFQTLGTLALHRFPDVYTRMHGATKCTTFGSLFIYAGVIVHGAIMSMSGNSAYLTLAVHTLFVMTIILLTNPTGAHSIARAAHRSGVRPAKAIVDDLEGKG
jgi:multicomponent Na+:H+ antiporter subunit G